MKKPIFLLLILISNFSYGQTKDLQQSIDSFRMALNEQNMQIKQLRAQVYNLTKILNAVKTDLNDVPDYARIDTTGAKCCLKSKTSVKSTVVKHKNVSTTVPNIRTVTEEPRDARYFRTMHGKKYYIARNGKIFYLASTGKRIYVNRL